MKYHFCTYFDANYICLGLALHESLTNTCEDFTLYVCCLDAKVFEILTEMNLPTIVPLKLSDIEIFDPEFAATQQNRSIVEYYFTLSPILPSYIFSCYPEINLVTYLDSDLYFYSSPEPMFNEFDNNSLSLIGHRFPPELEFREKFGKYNLQCQIYRRDNNTTECLKWWRERCIEWCYDRLEGDKFADQKYLEQWSSLFNGVKVIEHKGAGLAPWNWFQYDISLDDNKITIDQQPLIFYHFQGFRILGTRFISHNLGSYGHSMNRQLLNFFYNDYYHSLKRAEAKLTLTKAAQNINLKSNLKRTGFSNLRGYLSAIKHHNLMFVKP